jgi:hypothetical protein
MKKLLLYLGMISVPLLGLLGILKLGSRLQAPASVGGQWTLESPSGPACDSFQAFLQSETIHIAQSGPHLVITLVDKDHTQLRGELDGETVRAAIHRPAALQAVQLTARVDRSADPDRFQGQVTDANCSGALVLEGTRLPPINRGGLE